MLNLFTYQTPLKFANAFKEFYNQANLKQIRILSMTLFVISLIARMIALIYYKEVIEFANYHEHSLGNWIQLSGASLFYVLSTRALQSGKWAQQQKKILTLAFVVFILLITFGVSYTVSLYNTKNTLTMFLIGIVAVSLFFAIEYHEITAIAILMVIVFITSVVAPKLSFQDKMMNILASFILGFILISFSRYSYYFKSQHFVRLKQLEEKNMEIERLHSQKGEILGFVAHDLRNPLNNIEALSTIMTLENEANEEAKMISSAAQQAKNIINDLVEAVKTEQSQLQVEEIELNAYLSSLINRWNTNLKNSLLFKGTDHTVSGRINPSKLERVIDNLVSNASKFSPIDKAIVIELINYTTHVCIKIKDQGIGIPSHLHEHLFNQFSIAGRKGLLGEKSIGLGLHISKKIVEQHYGQLTFESKENEGTTFTILLPVV